MPPSETAGSTLKAKIGAFDAASGTVAVTFTAGAIVHSRRVNAVVTGGKYDARATKARVAEVGRGVAAKIDLGVIAAPPEKQDGAA